MERSNVRQLPIDDGKYIFHKQDVADLFALPTEIGERQFRPVRDDPPDYPALVRMAEMGRSYV
jgi:hypothetical protein